MCQVSLFYRVRNCKGPSKEKDCKRWQQIKKEAATNLKYRQLASQLYNQMMPRLPGCLFKFIQKQPPKVFILLVDVRKLKSCSCKFLAKFSRKTPVCQIRVSFLKSIKKETLAQLLSCEFCEIVFHRTPLGILAAASEFCFFLLIFLSTSFSQLASQLYTVCIASQLGSYPIVTVSVLKLSYFL